MKISSRHLAALTILTIACLSVPSKAARVYSWVEPDTLTLGDPIEITIAAVVPSGATVVPPDIEAETFGEFVVREWTSRRDETISGDSVQFKYLATAYTNTADTIPSLKFLSIRNDTTDTLFSPMLRARVVSVLQPDSLKDDSVMIKDLKAQQVAGTPSLLWLWITLGTIGIAVLVVLARYFRGRKEAAAYVPPPKPPYEEAIEALNTLEARSLVRMGQIRDYVFGISEILKRYIERRFGVNSVEYTTEEMLGWIPQAPVGKENRERLDWFFRTTEPVKYAKFIPDDETLYRFAEETRVFLENTRPRVGPETENGSGGGTSGNDQQVQQKHEATQSS